jgi:peroxiredoxin
VQTRERLALVIALALTVPLVFAFARAMADGATRHRETPLRAVLGDDRYEALMDGEGGFPHYLGNDRRAPDFTLRDRRGRPFRLSDHRGRVVVLNFWSITCPPCLEEMPSVETLARIAGRWGDVDVVTISTDDSWDEVSPLIARDAQATYLLDPTDEVVVGKYGTRLYPETWIIDREGIVRFRYDGARDWSEPVMLGVIESFR